MYRHLHAPLPLEQLAGVPQSVVAVIEMLLEKDPSQRLQTPAELLKVMPALTSTIEAGGGIIYQCLRQMRVVDSYAVTRKVPARLGPEKISIARLPVTGSDIFGRKEDIDFLDNAWASQDANIVTVVAWGGVGKSTLINQWLRGMATEHYRLAELVFAS